MVQELILLSDVEGLGEEGSVVKVHDGYARNYLIPRKLAAAVTAASRKRLEKIRKDREIRLQAEEAAARVLAARIEAASVSLSAKAGEGEKLFGSVTPAHIADALKLQGIEVERHMILMDEPIKELGVFNISVKTHPQVQATLKVWVVEE